MGSTTTTVSTYTQGTLIIDIWDAKTNKLLWRGSAEAVVPSNPGKQEALIYKAIDKMATRWDRMRQRREDQAQVLNVSRRARRPFLR